MIRPALLLLCLSMAACSDKDTTDDSGTSSTDGGTDGGTETCDMPMPDPVAFACGDALTCTAGTEYCYAASGGAKPKKGESGTTYACRPIPAACSDCPSCDCVLYEDGYLPDRSGYQKADCSVDDDGALSIWQAFP